MGHKNFFLILGFIILFLIFYNLLIKRMLHYLSSVEAAIDALPEPTRTEAKIEWEYSSEVQRHNGFVSDLAPMLGLSEADLDNLFTLAATK